MVEQYKDALGEYIRLVSFASSHELKSLLPSRRKVERKLNTFQHFKSIVTVDGRSQSIHFVGLFSKNDSAIPIALFHGWPGLFSYKCNYNSLQLNRKFYGVPSHTHPTQK